ncbi:MAG: UDP-diphosphatase, partial [Acidobacteria bacterium]|nr:UDP-diphosphatase [Acidobacteriota bacterium]
SLLIAGVLVSAVVGYVTIKFFLRFLGGNTLDGFALYRLVLAGVTFAWLMKQ